MRNKLTMFLLSFLILLGLVHSVTPLTAHACSCAGPVSMEEQLSRKTAIFTGKLISLSQPDQGMIWSSADPVSAQFEVMNVWKGELGAEATVYTARSSESCGYEGFEVDEEFIVFAYGPYDQLKTGICEGTKELGSAQEELAALGAGYKPVADTSHEKNASEALIVNKNPGSSQVWIVPLMIIAAMLAVTLLVILRKRRKN
ncbi:hypothetical protein PUW24_02695 [Paenibacillus urinalis]|uniref:Tissue inhibitor of metalloproteinase n=1 Tax=Paenibacillus urinalis TaxID=521520 RepID=A0AAX3MW74_9BACL|nr:MULTISPECIES: hypothetical protein [Paenibacillus]WDH81858.1 hypothetical protein PUW23_20540 [Paenibacillus urinalis]WDH97908.1 hypothetical protein PUW24_02695 [Paenibacillus urinalis]WDI01587.1 hypothetical protein PUW25_20430 [Paenibacillus urinalis]GAK43456.1 hypothetical protein TCA2_5954 [Paenibacillus sp. TCA20]